MRRGPKSLLSFSTTVKPVIRAAASGGNSSVPLITANAYDMSCFKKIDWRIDAESPVADAIERMARNQIGALAVTQGRYIQTCSKAGQIVGIITERDIISKLTLLGLDSSNVDVKSICTFGVSNLIMVPKDSTVEEGLQRMLLSDIRHLLVYEGPQAKENVERPRDEGIGLSITGLISIKDMIKCVLVKHSEKVKSLREALTDLGIDQLSHCEMEYSMCSVNGNGLGMASYSCASVDIEEPLPQKGEGRKEGKKKPDEGYDPSVQ